MNDYPVDEEDIKEFLERQGRLIHMVRFFFCHEEVILELSLT